MRRSNSPAFGRLRILRLGGVFLLFLAACRTGPPAETGRFRDPDLVEIIRLDPGIRLDIRYASADNFTGRPLYPGARAFLQRPAAEALVRAHRALRAAGWHPGLRRLPSLVRHQGAMGFRQQH